MDRASQIGVNLAAVWRAGAPARDRRVRAGDHESPAREQARFRSDLYRYLVFIGSERVMDSPGVLGVRLALVTMERVIVLGVTVLMT